MSADDTKKRKACQSCTRSKAKCSPFEGRSDLCYRCQRLGKSCFFEETARKKVPKSRSRVKQLEQRVDALIGLIESNSSQNVDATKRIEGVSYTPLSTPKETPPHIDSDATCPKPAQQPVSYITPAGTPKSFNNGEEPLHTYDPVQAGVLTRDFASQLLKEFGESFTRSFPFVVVPPTTNADALRMNSPFLFLTIMTVMTYKTPAIQRTLNTELKEQIADRIVRKSHKSLEILQGLLIYGSWYHFFYNPKNQQMATVVQLCVAMVQDLGISKSQKEKEFTLPTSEEHASLILQSDRSLAERRAFLGSYHLTVGFAQAWRKRSTMRHTRYMTLCCQMLAERKEYPTDVFITPLIELSELTCRVNDYFSYDDIDNAEVNGDMMLSFTTLNFRSDLDRIRSSIDADAQSNKNLYLSTCLVEIWIYECALHGTFWSSPSPSDSSAISVTRTVGLYHCLNAMNTYLNTLLGCSQEYLYHLAFTSWSGWFYAIIVACKLVFLEDNERRSQTDLESVSSEVSRLCAGEDRKTTFAREKNYELYRLPIEVNTSSRWDPIVVAREAEIHSLFDRFIKKMEFTIPSTDDCFDLENIMFDPLFCMLCLQRNLLQGFSKRMKDHLTRLPESAATPGSSTQSATTIESEDIGSTTSVPQHSVNDSFSDLPSQPYLRVHDPNCPGPIPIANSFHFNSINFDTITPPESLPAMLHPFQDDSLWDTVMNDFTLPF